jgi:hypothetical protein
MYVDVSSLGKFRCILDKANAMRNQEGKQYVTDV